MASVNKTSSSSASGHSSVACAGRCLRTHRRSPKRLLNVHHLKDVWIFNLLFKKQIHSKHWNVSFMLNIFWFQSSYLLLPE